MINASQSLLISKLMLTISQNGVLCVMQYSSVTLIQSTCCHVCAANNFYFLHQKAAFIIIQLHPR